MNSRVTVFVLNILINFDANWFFSFVRTNNEMKKTITRVKIIDIAANESETRKAIPLNIIKNSCA